MGAGYVSTPLSSFGGWLLASNAPTERDLRTARVPIGHPSRIRSRIVAQVPARTSAPRPVGVRSGLAIPYHSFSCPGRQNRQREKSGALIPAKMGGIHRPRLTPPQGQNHLQGGRRPHHLSPSEQRGPPDIPACDSGM